MHPPENVPEFLCEEIEKMDDDIRMAVAAFAERGGSAPAQVPDTIRWAFAVQEDDVIEKTGEYAQRLAEMGESEEVNPVKTESDSNESDSPSDNNGSDEAGSGLFSGGF
ncbi:hypothetical protein [Natrinema halophilum]|uniref:hypothetical protein n=1 Tax=Natrinema halophilum TaxID=1699371 RepID=UPI001F2F14D7|nr:hypothetical protein [Natrinema halophilum]UHQ96120.1 hypothetical protein HYG82_22620 [Natrinema halophilum]